MTHAPAHPPPRRLALSLLAAVAVLLAWSAYHPHDYETWALEVFPVFFGCAVLAWTFWRFPLTPLTYCLLAIHSAILIVGGHYTYANVPIGDWFKDAFHLSRNHYDRLGHLAQGFVPAMVAREVVLRNTPLKRGGWLAFLVFCVCMAISATYELVEWAVAEIDSSGSQEFLGTQGDVWDTQKDMAFCAVGAILSPILLSRWQDRQLSKILRAPPQQPVHGL